MKTVKTPALDMCFERQQTPCNFVEVFYYPIFKISIMESD